MAQPMLCGDPCNFQEFFKQMVIQQWRIGPSLQAAQHFPLALMSCFPIPTLKKDTFTLSVLLKGYVTVMMESVLVFQVSKELHAREWCAPTSVQVMELVAI